MNYNNNKDYKRLDEIKKKVQRLPEITKSSQAQRLGT